MTSKLDKIAADAASLSKRFDDFLARPIKRGDARSPARNSFELLYEEGGQRFWKNFTNEDEFQDWLKVRGNSVTIIERRPLVGR